VATASTGIRAVIFDLYGTLVYEPTFEDCFPALAAAIGVDLAVYLPIRDETIVDAMVGRLPTAEARAAAILAGLGRADADGLAAQLAEIERAARWPRVQPYATTVPTLRALRERRFPIGLVSDCTGLMGRPILELLDLLPWFDATALSYEVGYAKPAPEI
jgi:FMN phosphatase YigB (HAD superfamily)